MINERLKGNLNQYIDQTKLDLASGKYPSQHDTSVSSSKSSISRDQTPPQDESSKKRGVVTNSESETQGEDVVMRSVNGG
eukprot:TRINITY_DN4807_c1_g1_i1.p2 TRINITY_DN4807_c1_g1~~TRINITY_DN4807_c1_g1_i1.p2  ORF type:complete len:80 (-),score=17.84 TRINITY_DN4807_c1_g1_i1:135-374(-)